MVSGGEAAASAKVSERVGAVVVLLVRQGELAESFERSDLVGVDTGGVFLEEGGVGGDGVALTENGGQQGQRRRHEGNVSPPKRRTKATHVAPPANYVAEGVARCSSGVAPGART